MGRNHCDVYPCNYNAPGTSITVHYKIYIATSTTISAQPVESIYSCAFNLAPISLGGSPFTLTTAKSMSFAQSCSQICAVTSASVDLNVSPSNSSPRPTSTSCVDASLSNYVPFPIFIM